VRLRFGLPVVLLVLGLPSLARAELTDLRSPVHVGWGFSGLFRGKVMVVSFEDEVFVHRLAPDLELGFVVGLDSQRAALGPETQRGFLAVDLGVGLLARLGRPALIASVVAAPLFGGRREDDGPDGAGVSARLELVPFYESIHDAIECHRGAFQTYVLRGLHGWVAAREDRLVGRWGPSFMAGFGVDLTTNLLLPVMGAVAGGACSRPPPPEELPIARPVPEGSPVKVLPP
jgi:hypothetical protein